MIAYSQSVSALIFADINLLSRCSFAESVDFSGGSYQKNTWALPLEKKEIIRFRFFVISLKQNFVSTELLIRACVALRGDGHQT